MKPPVRPLRFLTTALAALVLTPGVAQADLGDLVRKFHASDSAKSDVFGVAIAVSGSTAIVGSYFDDDNGVNSGSAYLFNTNTGAQIRKLTPSDGAQGDVFGNAVAISGLTAIVAAPYDDDNGKDSGSAYLFNVLTGAQTAKLKPNDGSVAELFAWSVGISDTTAIAGAFADSDNGTYSGSAYLFSTKTGAQLRKLLPNDPALFKSFGVSVAISGSIAIVGASGDATNGNGSGAAYLFDVKTGAQLAKLLPSDGATLDAFGASVAISGSTAIVGATGDDDNGNASGSAYLFDVNTGTQIAKLLASDGAVNDSFGLFVGISGPTAIVGAPLNDDPFTDSGSAYLFDAATGTELIKLIPGDVYLDDQFGWSVGISGSTVVVGAPREDAGAQDAGSAYSFEAPLPVLAGNEARILLSTGGTQKLSLDAGASHANRYFFMFGSVTGTTPGLDFGGGLVLPLNFDAYFNLTLNRPGIAAFGNFRGQLDGSGRALSTLTLPAVADPSLIGVTMNHAYLDGVVLGFPDSASNAIPVLLAP